MQDQLITGISLGRSWVGSERLDATRYWVDDKMSVGMVNQLMLDSKVVLGVLLWAGSNDNSNNGRDRRKERRRMGSIVGVVISM